MTNDQLVEFVKVLQSIQIVLDSLKSMSYSVEIGNPEGYSHKADIRIQLNSLIFPSPDRIYRPTP